MLSIVNFILGGALLVLGRKLFWLFVATGGFIAGILLATRVTEGPEWLPILIGLAVGIAFALLALSFKTLAIGLSGFFLGGSILSAMAGAFGMADGPLDRVIYIVGGVIGIFLAGTLFDWALIGLSALAGALLILQAFSPTGAMGGLAFLALLLIGISVQAAVLRGESEVKDD